MLNPTTIMNQAAKSYFICNTMVKGTLPTAFASSNLATSLTDISLLLYLPVPLNIRNAPTKLMEQMGYGAEYRYPHDYPGHFYAQQYMPDAISGVQLWNGGDSAAEAKMKEQMTRLWGDFKKY